MNLTHISFPVGDITLEGELNHPEGPGPFPGVIICHPHPLYGGNMLNNVVTAICQALVGCSIAVFRFNFRGVGNSGGTFGGGIAEQEDVRAALAFLLSTSSIDAERIGLAGYSFGAGVALPVALQEAVISRLALVSPTLSTAGWEQLKEYAKPKLLIVGEADPFIPQERFQQQVKEVAETKQCRVISGADHFWWGYEEAVAREVAQFLATGFR